ncbi:unnamed protein product [Tilletia caries]|nr:unnamed protein product [Tilletia caries]
MDQPPPSAIWTAEDVSGDGTPTIRGIISSPPTRHVRKMNISGIFNHLRDNNRPHVKWERDGCLLECEWRRCPGFKGHEFVLLTFGFPYQDRPTDELRMRKLTCRLDRWADEPAQFNPFRATTSSSFLGSSSRKRKVPGIHHIKISRVQPDSWTDGGKEKKATNMGHIKMTDKTSKITLFHAIAAAHGYKDKAPNYDAYTAKCWSFSPASPLSSLPKQLSPTGCPSRCVKRTAGEMVLIDSTERLDELLKNMDAEDIDAEGFLSSPGALCGAAAGASAALYAAPGISAVAYAAASGTVFGGPIGVAFADFAAAAVTLFGASTVGGAAGAAGSLALRKVASRKSHKLLSEIRQYVDNLEKHLL